MLLLAAIGKLLDNRHFAEILASPPFHSPFISWRAEPSDGVKRIAIATLGLIGALAAFLLICSKLRLDATRHRLRW